VRRFLPELIDLIWNRQIDSGKVFDLERARRGRRRLPSDGPARGDMQITRNSIDTQKGSATGSPATSTSTPSLRQPPVTTP